MIFVLSKELSWTISRILVRKFKSSRKPIMYVYRTRDISGLFYRQYWVIFTIENSIFFPNQQEIVSNWNLQIKIWIKNSKIIKGFLLCLNDGRCHHRQLFFLFFKSMKNFNQVSLIHFPIFNKTLLKFPLPWVWVMFPKILEKISTDISYVYQVMFWPCIASDLTGDSDLMFLLESMLTIYFFYPCQYF